MDTARVEASETLVAAGEARVVNDFLDALDAHDRALLALRLIRSLDSPSRATVIEILSKGELGK